MIGDSECDMEAARRAGCHTAAIGALDAEIQGTDLLDCIDQILKKRGPLNDTP
jgi:phosphoglycolate phosphatase-like HAD superfamily hydrolase